MNTIHSKNNVFHVVCLFSWIAVDDGDDEFDDVNDVNDHLTSISNTTHSKNNEYIVLS